MWRNKVPYQQQDPKMSSCAVNKYFNYIEMIAYYPVLVETDFSWLWI